MSDSAANKRIFLVRHGETEWSRSWRHTSRTDVALTPEGERRASLLAPRLATEQFRLVMTSPMQRATRTCELCGFAQIAERTPDLMEWDYGSYEGLTTAEIRVQVPSWTVFHDLVPGGETGEQVAARVQRVIDRALAVDGDALFFAHGHVLRVLTATWLGLSPEDGEHFVLDTGALSILGFEREARVIKLWNSRPGA